MNLPEMFAAHLRRVRRVEKTCSTLGKTEIGVEQNLGKKPEIQPSAPSARILVPRDEAWREGERYSLAGEVDANRLDLFIADKNGPWLRRHGVLMMSVQPPR